MSSFLTERQKAILDFILEFRCQHGIAPTHREICERFGFSSYGTAYKHLKLLAEKGFLKRDRHQRRGLELLPSAGVDEEVGAELPFLGRIAAGRPIEAVTSREAIGVPRLLFGERLQDHYVLRVTGESMIEEGIHDGDWVVVERRERARPGEMVVALLGGDEVTLKRFYPEGDEVRLQPANPAMAPLRVAASDVRVQGIVVGLMRRY
ncbi:MAG: transcriptional repressor LexA [Thermoanaerobaculia bacterium]|nr:MAG: transcriptional repressor LexA [Thermoanaerobaculia bacterium]